MSLFIQTAHAAAAPAPAGPSMMGQLIMIAGFIVIFYFIMWRPQAKRQKEHKSMIESVANDHEVVFAGGLMGVIKKVDGDYAVVTVGNNDITIQKSSIISVLPAGTIAGLK